ncbi:MAG: hypothetical protein U0W94_02755 [Buchnera aphidicola (Schlechtendalia peitan)]
MINKDFVFGNKFKYSNLKKNNNKNNNVITAIMVIFIIILMLLILTNFLLEKKIFNNSIHNLKSKNIQKTTITIPKKPKEKWKYIYELKNEK